MSSRTYRAAFISSVVIACIAISCKTNFPTTRGDFIPVKNASVDRGRMLVQSSCAGCHYDPKTHRLSGRQFHGSPKIAGPVYAANLTNSISHSPFQKYTEAEFAYLMRTGIARNGENLLYMLRPNMSDKDISAMYAYLHSDDSSVQAVNAVSGLTNLNFLGNWGKAFMPRPLPWHPSVPAVNENDPIAYGRYLVDNIGCFHCHSKAKMLKIDYEHPEQTKGYMAGGRKFKMPDGIIRGPNITADVETGIGGYTKEQFRTAVLQAKDKNGNRLKPPMEAFHHMSDQEADAIYAYIHTLAPVKHEVN